jgi:hypothetical protein
MPVVRTAALKGLFQLTQQLMTLFSKRVSNSGGSFHTGLALVGFHIRMDLCLCHRYSLALPNLGSAALQSWPFAIIAMST